MIRVVKEEKSSNIITPSDIEDLYKNYGLELEEGPVIYIPYGAPSMGLDDYAPGLFEGIYSVCSAIDDNDEVKEIVEKMFGKMIDDWYPALKNI